MSFITGNSKTHARAARIHIDSEALQHNLNRAKSLAGNSKVMAVVKADAYGHGVMPVVHALSEADAFALAMTDEAIKLRTAGISKPLVVFHGFADAEELSAMVEFNIQPVIHQHWQIDILERISQEQLSSQNPDARSSKTQLGVWLKVDTGMHRLGISEDDVESVYSRLKACAVVGEIRIMSHFANADEPGHTSNEKQLSSLTRVTKDIDVESSMANSAALIAIPESRLQWVRPGIMLYGSSPLIDKSAEELDIKPVMTFESRLCAVRLLKKGDVIGYGSTWQCPEDMQVGVVAAGYADGYPRHAKSGTPVWINGANCSLLGRVSMDSICVDLRGVSAEVGDRVVLWGKELSVDEVAKNADTISYELLCNAGNAGV
jgi:alanine racemase